MKSRILKNKNSLKHTPKKAKSKEITKKMTFMEVMQISPEAAWVLMNKGMHCAGCHLAANETIEQGAIMHGINPDKLVKELNSKLNKKSSKKKR
jgi:hybrid cluster-associated redox disulfide protein